jgi:hypothetical protein
MASIEHPIANEGNSVSDDYSVKKNLIKIVALLAFVGVIWGAVEFFDFGGDSAKNAAVGDCMKNEGTSGNPDLTIVDCSSSDAIYKVVTVHKDSNDTTLCTNGTTGYTERTTSGRKKRRHTTTVTLCLTPLK